MSVIENYHYLSQLYIFGYLLLLNPAWWRERCGKSLSRAAKAGASRCFILFLEPGHYLGGNIADTGKSITSERSFPATIPVPLAGNIMMRALPKKELGLPVREE